MNELFLIPGCRIEQVARAGPTTVQISTQGTQSGAACPNCRTLSQAVHSRYRRRPADLPNLGSTVCLDLLVRRFYCRNTACARRTFAEPLPDLLAPRARRTYRLAATQEDEAAIRAALTMPWSSGQAEGRINKLKLISAR